MTFLDKLKARADALANVVLFYSEMDDRALQEIPAVQSQAREHLALVALIDAMERGAR